MPKKIFVVTGANKGIGFGIVRNLAENLNGAIVYLTSRNVDLGQAALKKVKEELGDKQKSEILYHQLDITDEASCQTFANYLKEKHGGIDVLINNAGFAYKNSATESAEEQAKVTNDINYYGLKTISNYLQPLIRDGGRAAKDGNRKELGFPESSYRISKTAAIAYTLLQSKALTQRNIIVNACCPGYVDTDMSSHSGPLTIAEGADTPCYLAVDPNAPKGEFVYQRNVISWH